MALRDLEQPKRDMTKQEHLRFFQRKLRVLTCLPHGARDAGLRGPHEAPTRQVPPAQPGTAGGRAHRRVHPREGRHLRRRGEHRRPARCADSAASAEISRTVSSVRPFGIVSDSMSVTKPYAYSLLTSASIEELIGSSLLAVELIWLQGFGTSTMTKLTRPPLRSEGVARWTSEPSLPPS